MKHLSIPRNQFTGSLPESLGLMTQLEVLVLEENMFSNSVPSELGNLSNLHALILAKNQLSGVLPSELGQLTNLSFLTVEGNSNLGGTLPTELAALNDTLQGLQIKATSISGTFQQSCVDSMASVLIALLLSVVVVVRVTLHEYNSKYYTHPKITDNRVGGYVRLTTVEFW